jgi:hypothetical protein
MALATAPGHRLGRLAAALAFGALGAWALWFGLYAHPGEPRDSKFWKPTVLYWTLAAIMIVCAVARRRLPRENHPRHLFRAFDARMALDQSRLRAIYAVLGGCQSVGGPRPPTRIGSASNSLPDESADHRAVPLELRLAADPRGGIDPSLSARPGRLPGRIEPVLSGGGSRRAACAGAPTAAYAHAPIRTRHIHWRNSCTSV